MGRSQLVRWIFALQQHRPTCVIWLHLRKAAESEMDRSYTVPLSLPWTREGPFTQYLMCDQSLNGKSRFHLYDPWHLLHLGVGKAWAASSLMEVQHTVEESSVDKRIAVLSRAYKAFCRQQKLTPYIKRIDINLLGGGGSKEPLGTWSKASVTSNMMLFLEDYLRTHEEIQNGNLRLQIIVPYPIY